MTKKQLDTVHKEVARIVTGVTCVSLHKEDERCESLQNDQISINVPKPHQNQQAFRKECVTGFFFLFLYQNISCWHSKEPSLRRFF